MVKLPGMPVKNVDTRLIASVEASTQCVVLLEAIRDDSGQVIDLLWIYTNAMAENVLGHSRDFFNGNRYLTVMLGTKIQGLFDACKQVLETGEPYNKELHFIHDDQKQWLGVRVVKVDDCVCVTFVEIGNPLETDRFARAIVGALPYNIAITDEKGNILAVNQAWNEFSQANNGPNEKETLGLNYLDICESNHTAINSTAKAMAQGLRDVMSGKSSTFKMEYPCHSPLEERWFEARATRFMVRESIRLIISHENITARKMIEFDLKNAITTAEKASEAKTQFLANMSHEIRTPMTAILGFTGMLEELWERGMSRQQRAEIFSTIKRSGDHLLRVINDILDIAKIESDQVSVENIQTSPLKILEHVIATQEASAAAKNISLELDLVTPVPTVMKSDPTRLQQILINLVANAVKFTEFGSVTVSIGVENAQDGSRKLYFKVKDTGIGMSPEVIPHLFQAFQQADTSHTRKYGGTGLGLRISRRLAQLLGGDITVESSLNHGSTFTLTLPLSPQDLTTLDAFSSRTCPGVQPQTQPDSQQTEQTLDGTCILVVEDNPDNQRLLLNLLMTAGAKVALADNGREAIELMTDPNSATHELLSPMPYSLVLMDIQIPVLNGYEATQKLREMGLVTPIIAVTAHAQQEDRAKCLAVGCDDYITKPIDRIALISLCSQWIGVGIARQTMMGE